MNAKPGEYNRLCYSSPNPRDADSIDQDLGRIFPTHRFFQSRGTNRSAGRTSLRNVLFAYACYDPEIGYCQGMGYIAILFLLYMPEDDAFWLLVAVMRDEGKYRLRGIFSRNLALTKLRCYQGTKIIFRVGLQCLKND